MLLCFRFCCADRTESISPCVNYFFIYFPREHLTLPYFLPCREELWRRGMALTWFEPACELCWLMSWDSLQLELLHKYGNPQSSLSVELNDRRMTRFIVIRFLFWKTVDRHKSCLKKKRWFIFINQYSHYCVNIMDLFYLNGSLLFLLLNYRWNILFSQKKVKKSNLTEEKRKTQFTALLTLYFLDFSLFSFFLMDSKSIYLLKLRHFQTPVTFGSKFCSPEMTKQGPHNPGIEVRHILYKVSVNSNCNIS